MTRGSVEAAPFIGIRDGAGGHGLIVPIMWQARVEPGWGRGAAWGLGHRWNCSAARRFGEWVVSGTNTRVPEEEELMIINIDSSEQSRA